GSTSRSSTEYLGGGLVRRVATGADGVQSESTYQSGRLLTEVAADAEGEALQSSTYSYDAHNRLVSTADGLGRQTELRYEEGSDRALEQLGPEPGYGMQRLAAAFAYDPLGRVVRQTSGEGASVETRHSK